MASEIDFNQQLDQMSEDLLATLGDLSICKTCNTSRHRECEGKFPLLQEVFEKMCFSILPTIRNEIILKLRDFRDEFKYEGSYTINMYVGQVHKELDDLIDLIIMAIPTTKPFEDEKESV